MLHREAILYAFLSDSVTKTELGNRRSPSPGNLRARVIGRAKQLGKEFQEQRVTTTSTTGHRRGRPPGVATASRLGHSPGDDTPAAEIVAHAVLLAVHLARDHTRPDTHAIGNKFRNKEIRGYYMEEEDRENDDDEWYGCVELKVPATKPRIIWFRFVMNRAAFILESKKPSIRIAI
jgi:hypothetical protein